MFATCRHAGSAAADIAKSASFWPAKEFTCITVQGNTALMIAAKNGHRSIINILLLHGASRAVKNYEVSQVLPFALLPTSMLSLMACCLACLSESNVVFVSSLSSFKVACTYFRYMRLGCSHCVKCACT